MCSTLKCNQFISNQEYKETILSIPDYCSIDTCAAFAKLQSNKSRYDLCGRHVLKLCAFPGCFNKKFGCFSKHCKEHSTQKCKKCLISEEKTILVDKLCDICTTQYYREDYIMNYNCKNCNIPKTFILNGKFYIVCSICFAKTKKTIDCYPITWPTESMQVKKNDYLY